MVGKGSDIRSSRIFHQCYLKCCKLQNLTPLNNVIPSGNLKVLDFCVDRIKYIDWPPILNALSCDLSLHSIIIKCRQQVKTVLEHIDCERLAKTVNNRCVMLTNFMLTNLVEALSQMLSENSLLTTLMLEGLPLKVPYLNPLCEALLTNSTLQHLYLPRSLIGDAGCLAICKSVRSLPNILTLDLSGCELTPLGAGYIADLLKYQKIHRYSENWTHTLRYRLPDLDTMAGLRRITLCGNPQLGDTGVSMLLENLADDLWIKALDVQQCSLTDSVVAHALQVMTSNTTLVVLDMRNNPDVSTDSLAQLRAMLRRNERGIASPFSWLASVSSSSSCDRLRAPVIKKEHRAIVKNPPIRNMKINVVKKEKEYAEVLEEQLQEEIAHRQQLEELNAHLVDQMKQMKQQQFKLWTNNAASSESEQSLQASYASGDLSTSSGSSSSVPIDHTTLSYIQQAFKDIYTFIKNNQCYGQCSHELPTKENGKMALTMEECVDPLQDSVKYVETDCIVHANILPKKAHSTHQKIDVKKVRKSTKSAHLLGDRHLNESPKTKPEMFEKHMGDTRQVTEVESVIEEVAMTKAKNSKNKRYSISPCSSVSSDTLVSPIHTQRKRELSASRVVVPTPINPREAFYSSSDSEFGSS